MKESTSSSLQQKIIFLSEKINLDKNKNVQQELTFLVNELINKDFDKLLQLLYRIDINEEKLKQNLDKNKSQDSAVIVAQMIVERQIEKMKSRKKYAKMNRDCEEEKW